MAVGFARPLCSLRGIAVLMSIEPVPALLQLQATLRIAGGPERDLLISCLAYDDVCLAPDASKSVPSEACPALSGSLFRCMYHYSASFGFPLEREHRREVVMGFSGVPSLLALAGLLGFLVVQLMIGAIA